MADPYVATIDEIHEARLRSRLDTDNDAPRTFLGGGDAVSLRAHCARDGFAGIGHGGCRGQVLAARR